jgi:hypothetical protein
MLVLFNPGLDIQTSTNALDWTALTTIELIGVTYSSRSIPIGTSDEIEISSLLFKVPIWLNPPAKLMRQKLIEQIITNISAVSKEDIDANSGPDIALMYWAEQDIFARNITTPGNHIVELNGNVLTLLGEDGNVLDGTGSPYVWTKLFDLYDKFRPGISQIRLKTNDNMNDHQSDVVGTIQLHPTNLNQLYLTIDITTLPENNLPAINGIIDPRVSWVFVPDNVGVPNPNLKPLPAPVVGDRYMILEPISPHTTWGPLSASENDIIEYGANGEWFVAFDASTALQNYTLVNTKTSKQLTWLNSDKNWILTLAGNYTPGFWRLAL